MVFGAPTDHGHTHGASFFRRLHFGTDCPGLDSGKDLVIWLMRSFASVRAAAQAKAPPSLTAIKDSGAEIPTDNHSFIDVSHAQR
jgi:hypothetical protein